MKTARQQSADDLESAWSNWPRSFPSFMAWVDQEGIPYLSHSRVADYVRCPACYYRRYVLGEKTESQAMLLGTLFHNAAVSFYKAKSAQEADKLFSRLRVAKFEEDRHGLLRNAITLLCQNRHSDCEVVSIEEPLFLDLDSGLPPIIGIADLIIRKGKSLVVVDHKTGKSFNDHDPAQLVLYAEHVGRLHNNRVSTGFFDEYRLVPNLDRIRKPAFRRTEVRLSKKMLPPMIRRYKSAWKEIQLFKKEGSLHRPTIAGSADLSPKWVWALGTELGRSWFGRLRHDLGDRFRSRFTQMHQADVAVSFESGAGWD